ncbi:MAG: ROK family protein [Pyrinomonadaceae bacterium]
MTSHSTTKSHSTKQKFVFVADLGGTHLRVAAVDGDGKIYCRQMQPTPQADEPNEIVRALIDGARECEHEVARLGGRIAAGAIAVPGTVDVDEGVVVRAPNVPSLNGFHLAAPLENEVKWPLVLENDANAAAVGEFWRGAGRGHSSLICVTLGTGVGGGIILDGKLWRGADGSAGEIGHIGIEPFAEVPCNCGSHGCLEVYASATAIVRMTREAKPRFPNSILQNTEGLTSKTIYEAGIQGDQLALEVFRQMGMYLGVGLGSLITVLNPEIIVIGGGLANGWELFEIHMHQEIAQRVFSVPARSVRIARAQCGDDAGLLGAAWLAFAGLDEKRATSK